MRYEIRNRSPRIIDLNILSNGTNSRRGFAPRDSERDEVWHEDAVIGEGFHWLLLEFDFTD